MFAVWQPMLPTDISAPVTSTLARLADPRVRQLYDPDRLIAERLKSDARAPQPEPDCCARDGTLWDLLVVYPPGVVWTDRLPAATTFNGPVVDVMGQLEAALTPRERQGGASAPPDARVTARSVTPISPVSSSAPIRLGAPDVPDRLVHLLDHQYTRRTLGWHRLKRADALRAAALREVARRLDCEAALARRGPALRPVASVPTRSNRLRSWSPASRT